MEIAKYRVASEVDGETAAQPANGAWVRFGKDMLLYLDEPLSRNAVETASRAQVRNENVAKDELHVVVQNGRLFQQHHPDVPVIHDRGRFLLVKLDPQSAEKIREKSETCFGILPLAEGQVVFEESDAAPVAGRAPVAFIKSLVDKLNSAKLEANHIMLTTFFTRHSTSADYTAASLKAQKVLTDLNYQTKLQTIAVNGGKSRNIIADKKGLGTGARKVVIVTAHLDSINLEDGPAGASPGADDNASGSAGVLEIARVFQNHKSQHDLRLILFGGEEQGLFGSKHYVAGLTASERAKIKAVVNMDMIGCLNIPTKTVLIEGAPVSQNVINGLKQSAATYTGLAVETSLNPFASDHVPFINAGLPAVLTIEGADSTNDRVHSARDTSQTINFEFALEILRMNVGFVAGEIGSVP